MQTKVATSATKRFLASVLTPLLIGSSVTPVLAATPATAYKTAPPKSSFCSTTVKQGPKGVTLFKPETKFSEKTKDLEIENARIFLQKLVPTDLSPVEGENKALAKAVTEFKSQANSEDLTAFKTFISNFPKSRWVPATEINLGERLFQQGYLTEALADWRLAWDSTKNGKDKNTKTVADRAIADIMILEARLGLTNQLDADIAACKNRSMYGSNELRMVQSKQSAAEQRAHPETSFRCGPFAVKNVLRADKKTNNSNRIVLKDLKCTKDGTNLSHLKALMSKAGTKYVAAKRNPGAPLIVPSVMHWRLGHFGALVGKNSGRYHLQDPTFDENGSVWLTEKAIDTESDGYFLVPEGVLPAGWTLVSEEDATKVWGKGQVSRPQQGKTSSQPKQSVGPSCQIGQMAVAESFLFQATLNIHDTPLRYKPPVGPAIEFLVNYNYLEGEQPTEFTYTNLGFDWTINWVSYLTLDASKNATVHVRGGGYETYNYTVPDNVSNPYVPDLCSQAQLTIPQVGTYQRQMPDGSIEVFNQPDSSGRIFMTQVLDPQGNATSIQYDTNFRLIKVTDVIGHYSTFSYLSDTPGNPGFYLLKQITDPFSRTATFEYDPTQTFLLSSTDQMGIKSSFAYDTTSSFINLLTTPYGSTGIQITESDTQFLNGNGTRFDFPDGTTSVVENVSNYQNYTAYWDREAMMLYPMEYTSLNEPVHSRITSWAASGDDEYNYTPQPVAATYQSPVDYPITYTYAGQGQTGDKNYITPGPINKPISIAQTGPSETHTQGYQFNAIGNMTQSVDPVGRTVSYLYAANNIDVLEKRQTRGTNNDLLGKWQFNNKQHLPNKYTDGSGQVSTMTYNSFGELLTKTDPNGSVWTNNYDANGFLTSTDGPLTGDQDMTSFTYDMIGRLSTITDSEGYVLTYSYDNGDRLTSTQYPDGTFEQNIYDKLDVVMSKDRIDRWTRNIYDSLRQRIAVVDPLGRKTQYHYCACGAVSKLTDPLGQETFWERDLEARVISKTYNDQSTVFYIRDGFGRVMNRIDALNQQTNYNYNMDDTLASKTYTNAVNPTSEVDYTWDQNYPRLSVVSNGWGAYNYAYVPYITDPFGATTTGAGKLSTVTNSVIANSAISYSYDKLGRVTNRSINGSANSDNWSYDAISRITNETNTLGSFDFHYVDDTPGSSKGVTRLASVNYPNGQITNYSWFNNVGDQRLQQINNLSPSSTILSQFNYQYDSAGEITQWGQQAGTNPVLQYGLTYDLAGQLTAANATLGNASGPTAANYNYGYDSASNRTSVQQSISQTIALSGTITVGDVLTISVANAALPAGSENFSYTVVSGDTLSTIAAQIAAGITSNSDFQSVGINATSSSGLITVCSINQNPTVYSSSTNSGATEIMTQGVTLNGTKNFTIKGTATASDVLTITVSDSSLSGATPVAYTVPAGASLSTIANGIASAVNSNSALQNIGVSSSSFGTTVSITSNSQSATTYTTSTSTGATETIAVSPNINGVTTGVATGTVTAGNVLSLVVTDNGLSGGSQTVSYTVASGDTLTSVSSGIAAVVNANTSLQNIGVTANASGAALNLKSTSLNLTTYALNANQGATVIIALVAGAGLQQSSYNAVNELVAQAPGGLSLLAGNTNKPVVSIDSASSNIRITGEPQESSVTGVVGPNMPETLLFTTEASGVQTLSIQNNSDTDGYFTFTVKNPNLPSGQESVTYTINASVDNYVGIAAAINADANLQALGFTATAITNAGQELVYFVQRSINKTSFTVSTSSGATESVLLNNNNNFSFDLGIKGAITAGDTITLSATHPSISSPINITYTVTSSDSLVSIANNIALLIDSNAGLQNLQYSAENPSTSTLLSSQSFQTSPLLSSGGNLVAVTGQDGGGNQKTNQFPLSTRANTTHTLTYDLNGNMTSDGTNTYQWDAENRLIQINYPGSGNNSSLQYDAFGKNVQIAEYTSGILISTKQFVWSDGYRREARDASGTVTASYFSGGEIISGASYFLTGDHLGSVREMTNAAGSIVNQMAYDPFGRKTKIQSAVNSDFSYGGYYEHAPSGLSLTRTRSYSNSIGRFVNRDTVSEFGASNLFSYVLNNPISFIDPFGLQQAGTGPGAGPGTGPGTGTGTGPGGNTGTNPGGGTGTGPGGGTGTNPGGGGSGTNPGGGGGAGAGAGANPGGSAGGPLQGHATIGLDPNGNPMKPKDPTEGQELSDPNDTQGSCQMWGPSPNSQQGMHAGQDYFGGIAQPNPNFPGGAPVPLPGH